MYNIAVLSLVNACDVWCTKGQVTMKTFQVQCYHLAQPVLTHVRFDKTNVSLKVTVLSLYTLLACFLVLIVSS